MGSMTFRAPLLTAISLAASLGCSADTAMQPYEARREAQIQPTSQLVNSPAAVVPENPADRSIRRELSTVIDRDADLKGREVSFIVTNGDVSVTGVVESETAREKINELAMGIAGVKSVANAVRVSP